MFVLACFMAMPFRVYGQCPCGSNTLNASIAWGDHDHMDVTVVCDASQGCGGETITINWIDGSGNRIGTGGQGACGFVPQPQMNCGVFFSNVVVPAAAAAICVRQSPNQDCWQESFGSDRPPPPPPPPPGAQGVPTTSDIGALVLAVLLALVGAFLIIKPGWKNRRSH